MNLRASEYRKRDLNFEKSLWNPIFLQMYFAIESVKSFFNSLPRQYLKIYDFGCGSKPYEKFCYDNEYYGIDIDIENKEADIFADVTSVPLEDKIADVVVSFYLLEHVENPQKVINEKYRILKEGGIIFMLVPLYWEEHEQPYDFFRFTRYGIDMMLKNAGFKEIDVRVVNSKHSILGINLVRLFSNRLTRFMIPIINYAFFKLEVRSQKKSSLTGTPISNVMTFSVKGRK
jgi:SAM-dependent methyltransferase